MARVCVLGSAPQRKERMRQLLLRHGIQNVALILGRIERFLENIFPVLLLDARIMSGRHMVAAQKPRALEQLVELHEAVAVDARIRRAAMTVAANKLADDLFLEILREIEHVVAHPQPRGDAPRVLHIVKRAAGVSARDARVLVGIELHRAAGTAVPRVGKQLRRDAGIHAAAHGNQNVHSFPSQTSGWRFRAGP